jgi:hypothetical protein
MTDKIKNIISRIPTPETGNIKILKIKPVLLKLKIDGIAFKQAKGIIK